MSEKWVKIKNYEQYEISNLGVIKMTANNATRKERILKPLKTIKNYFRVALYKDNKSKFFLIHRLVAEHFIPNPDNLPQVNHIDGNKGNNNIENLEWCSYRENIEHAILNKLSACGQRNGRSKLKFDQVQEIRNNKELNQYELAEKYKVSQSTINRIKSNKGWKI